MAHLGVNSGEVTHRCCKQRYFFVACMLETLLLPAHKQHMTLFSSVVFFFAAVQERESLNHAIVQTINSAASNWGVEGLRYEIKDISPPTSVKAAMDLQAEAERRKRAEILDSEGQREAAINRAEGSRRSTVLAAQGEAEAILARAKASAAAVNMLAAAISVPGGQNAVALRVAEQYVSAFARLAKAGNTILLPAAAGDVSTMVTQALATFGSISSKLPAPSRGSAAGVDSMINDNDPLLVSAMDAADAAEASSSAAAAVDDDKPSSASGSSSGLPDFGSLVTGIDDHKTAGGGAGQGDKFVPKPF